MCEFNKKSGFNRIDPCMRSVINFLKMEITNISILACCCGHKKYPMTIVMVDNLTGRIFDLMSGKTILRKKKFYKKDEQGYYYIPETVEGE